jgi:hypothetical protein
VSKAAEERLFGGGELLLGQDALGVELAQLAVAA